MEGYRGTVYRGTVYRGTVYRGTVYTGTESQRNRGAGGRRYRRYPGGKVTLTQSMGHMGTEPFQGVIGYRFHNREPAGLVQQRCTRVPM